MERNGKLLFTDLDGTLLTAEKHISQQTRGRLLEFIKKGNSLVLASGRPLESMMEVLRDIDLMDEVKKMRLERGGCAGGIYITAYNGAMLYDCMKSEVIAESCVDMETAQTLFDMARERNIHIHTYADDSHIVSCAEDKELAYYTKYVHLSYFVTDNLKNTLSHEPYKLIAIDLENRERLEALRKEVEGSALGAELACTFSNNYYLEFYHRRAGKGNALVGMCRALNVPVQNAAAVGDEENDVSMIEAAGLGAAMANANPKLKACADYVTKKDNDSDGIIEVIDLLEKTEGNGNE